MPSIRDAGIDDPLFNSHSFRIGAATTAATTAARVGLNDSLIEMLGHWKFSVFQLYNIILAATD